MYVGAVMMTKNIENDMEAGVIWVSIGNSGGLRFVV